MGGARVCLIRDNVAVRAICYKLACHSDFIKNTQVFGVLQWRLSALIRTNNCCTHRQLLDITVSYQAPSNTREAPLDSASALLYSQLISLGVLLNRH